ncbi:hypothetical protein J1N35_019559 [Gossypium stocksii]|uniref:Uncharacterized protein n=1 Tax=Gossypium stocksii TaxID=47602 RepID=A0A9D4A608_9ROSI|nr:hypothetical protein J1N35_019559 [Gossypium stocksii]
MKSKKNGRSISHPPSVIKTSNLDNYNDIPFNNLKDAFNHILKKMEAKCQLDDSLKEEVFILKREKEKIKTVIKEKNDLIVDLKKANEMLCETINKKDEMIAKTYATLKANE